MSFAALKYKKSTAALRRGANQTKPTSWESDMVSTHVSSDEVPNGAEIHSARAAPGVLSSVSPLIL